jgi:hypothetical protein
MRDHDYLMGPVRSRVARESFIAYLEARPQERFWQALRNWSGQPYVMVVGHDGTQRDPFHWEGRTPDDAE